MKYYYCAATDDGRCRLCRGVGRVATRNSTLAGCGFSLAHWWGDFFSITRRYGNAQYHMHWLPVPLRVRPSLPNIPLFLSILGQKSKSNVYQKANAGRGGFRNYQQWRNQRVRGTEAIDRLCMCESETVRRKNFERNDLSPRYLAIYLGFFRWML